MLRYITSFLLFVSTVSCFAKIEPREEGRLPFIRVGVDPSVLIKNYIYSGDVYGFDFFVDHEIKQNIFIVAEAGFATTSYDGNNFDYKSNGAFVKVGADLNLTQYLGPTDRDIFFFGLRYANSTFSQKSENVNLGNEWGDFTSGVSSETLNAHWGEVVFGMRTELFSNFFVGWTGRIKSRFAMTETEYHPYYIPGFGLAEAKTIFDLGINFSYALQLKRK